MNLQNFSTIIPTMYSMTASARWFKSHNRAVAHRYTVAVVVLSEGRALIHNFKNLLRSFSQRQRNVIRSMLYFTSGSRVLKCIENKNISFRSLLRYQDNPFSAFHRRTRFAIAPNISCITRRPSELLSEKQKLSISNATSHVSPMHFPTQY